MVGGSGLPVGSGVREGRSCLPLPVSLRSLFRSEAFASSLSLCSLTLA